jgi:hypothetical protein
MSGQPGGGQNQNEQGGQQQGGQPQGGQPQGGQPQGGQPQGGQPQARQPQGGQPQSGQPQGGQYAGGQSSSVDTALVQSWGTYGAILFALAGFGIGLFYFLVDAIDEPLLEVSGVGGGGGGFAGGFGTILMLVVPMMAVFLAAFVGVAVARGVDMDDSSTFQAAAVLMAVGTLVSFILSSFLISTTFDNQSIAFGGLIINSVLAAIVAAGVGAGGVWAERNQAPE